MPFIGGQPLPLWVFTRPDAESPCNRSPDHVRLCTIPVGCSRRVSAGPSLDREPAGRMSSRRHRPIKQGSGCQNSLALKRQSQGGSCNTPACAVYLLSSQLRTLSKRLLRSGGEVLMHPPPLSFLRRNVCLGNCKVAKCSLQSLCAKVFLVRRLNDRAAIPSGNIGD